MIYDDSGPTEGEATREVLQRLAFELQPLRRINNGGAPIVQDLLLDLGNLVVDLEEEIAEMWERRNAWTDDDHGYWLGAGRALDRMNDLLNKEHC